MYLDINDKSFCEAAIAINLLSNEQIQKALDQQKVDRAIGTTRPIGAYLFEANVLTKEQIAQIVSYQESHPLATDQTVSVQCDEKVEDSPTNTTTACSKEDAQGCGCASLVIAMFVFYIAGWRIVFGQPSLTIDSLIFDIGSRDFVCAGNAILFKFNSLFYGLYLTPRFFDSYFLSWTMLLIGFRILTLGSETEDKLAKSNDNK